MMKVIMARYYSCHFFRCEIRTVDIQILYVLYSTSIGIPPNCFAFPEPKGVFFSDVPYSVRRKKKSYTDDTP